MKKMVISMLSALMGAAIGAGIVGRAAGSKKIIFRQNSQESGKLWNYEF